jgi:protein TonB
MLILLVILVLLLHLFGLMWLRRPIEQVIDSAQPVPFKLEVSMLPSEPAKPVSPVPPVNPQPKSESNPKKTPQKPLPEKQEQLDMGELQELIKSQPTPQVARKSARTELNTTQTVTSAVLQERPKTPNARDNFLESDVHNPSPEYPEMALFLGYQGTAVARVHVSAMGLSDGVEIVHGSGHKILDESASKALKKWRFTPIKRPGSVIIFVNFILK